MSLYQDLLGSDLPDAPELAGDLRDYFPPALRHELSPDGSITDRPVTILGPDLRESATGENHWPACSATPE